MFKIRKENPDDYKVVFQIVKDAFEHMEHTDHDEQNLIERLRKSTAFIPQLSLVAEEDGKIAGYILFTKVTVGDTVQLALAPVAVRPEYQGKGIGGKLIMEGHAIAKQLGYEYCIVLGHAAYYPRFGYFPASKVGISAPFDVADENFMAVNLQGRHTILNGTVKYPQEFGI